MEVLSSRVLLRSPDPGRTREFYEQVIELPIYREFGGTPGGGVVFFLGGGFLEVSGRQDARATDATQLWLQVRDLKATYRHLEERGVPIDEPPVLKPWGLWELRARDPDGRVLVFVEVPPDHPLRRDTRGG